jgi:AraC-like DNA-binding protein
MKPFEARELLARIKNLLEQRKRVHEHFKKNQIINIEEGKLTPVDKKFLQEAVGIINKYISDSSFSVEMLAENLAVSRSLLHKKLIALIGEAPSELIKRIRINKAAKLIEHKTGNISEIALEVGFNNPSYFTECFRKQFGCKPSEYHTLPS